MTIAPPVFELEAVTQRFGSLTALAGVSFKVEKGERVAVIGPSGAGKSTLLALMNGSLMASEGRVCVLGHDLARRPLRALRLLQRQIGTVHQQFDLVGSLPVIHNVNAGRLGYWPLWKALLSLFHPVEVPAAQAALARVGIPEKLYERTDALSGGQRQRVALARVLVQDPVAIAILADEPIASLDPERGREIMDLLRDLCIERGKTLVVSLHAVEYARTHCQRIIGLREGAIFFDLPAQALTDARMAELYRLENGQG